MIRSLAIDLIALLSLAALLYGVALVYVPAAFIVGGLVGMGVTAVAIRKGGPA